MCILEKIKLSYFLPDGLHGIYPQISIKYIVMYQEKNSNSDVLNILYEYG